MRRDVEEAVIPGAGSAADPEYPMRLLLGGLACMLLGEEIRASDDHPRHREWQDTVLMQPREKVEVAFVADNPGDWMFHCHILEHQESGMMGVIRVA